jgi:hypothetical protein
VSEDLELPETDATGAGAMMLKIDDLIANLQEIRRKDGNLLVLIAHPFEPGHFDHFDGPSVVELDPFIMPEDIQPEDAPDNKVLLL